MFLTQAAIIGLNHLLQNEIWARTQLQRYADQAVEFRMPIGTVRFAINANGLLCPVTDQAIAVKITIPQTAFAAFLSKGSVGVRKHIRIEGDVEFAGVIAELMENLRWETEEDLAQWLGPAGAHTLAMVIQRIHRYTRHFAKSQLENGLEYAIYEQPTLVQKTDLHTFTENIVSLRDDVARAEKRIQRLQKLLSTTHPHSS